LTVYKTLRLSKNLQAVEAHESAVGASDAGALHALHGPGCRIEMKCSLVEADKEQATIASVPLNAVAHRALTPHAASLQAVIYLFPVHGTSIEQ
jgi:hypothetical protein